MMNRFFTIIALAMLPLMMLGANPKREFRGAWMHTIGQSQYADQTTAQNKAYLSDQLDKLQAAGVNAVIFQVRPAADAFYNSHYELWSKYLTKGGKAPSPYWDPLQYMITECHKRGMELHAWLNPYRVTTTKSEKLPEGHLYYKEPKRFVKYEGDGKIYFDPGLPENREFIAKVVMDIVNNYDVDAIHMDDYFYPYPANKKDFPDNASYKKYGKGMNRGDWRRQNVDQLIELIHDKIRSSRKPWVRFGISPFGIWRNKASDPKGSNTNGLQNYDDLYADVLKWAEKGWIDYLVPQLYWELNHTKASYITLVDWWADAVDPKCQLYIGQDVEKTMTAPTAKTNQLDKKVAMTRARDEIQGNCWWPGYSLTKNSQGSATALTKTHQSTPALVPAYPNLSKDKPSAVKKVRIKGDLLTWKAADIKGKSSDPMKYVVYKCVGEGTVDIDNPENIVAITTEPQLELTEPGYYVVTAVDRLNNESKPSIQIRRK